MKRQLVPYQPTEATHTTGVRKVEAEEPMDCPLCGLQVLSALKARQKPAVLVRPGWMRCSCRGEAEWHVATELEKLAEPDHVDPRTREARECFYEDANRDVEPGSESKGKTREKVYGEPRSEQDWAGYPGIDAEESHKLEKLVVVVKGKVPTPLAQKLRTEARALGQNKESLLTRWLISQHLPRLTVADVWEVPTKGPKVMLEVMLTRQHSDLWGAAKAGLSTEQLKVSNADLLATLILKEWG